MQFSFFKKSTPKETEQAIHAIKKRTSTELDLGYDLIKKYPRSVSILGSARFKEGTEYYEKARSLAKRIATELNYAVVTGGGPGIMEAANRGAKEGNGVSIGFTIKLPKEQSTNPYVTESADFEYFFNRKELLFFAAETYIYFPGGYGTFDELFSMITMIQTNKYAHTPVILVGSAFWNPILAAIEPMFLKHDVISPEDTEIYKVVDDENEIIEIIKNAPIRNH